MKIALALALCFAAGPVFADCRPTGADILGPFYLPDAPFVETLCDAPEGKRLVVSGRVLRAPDCRPLAGVVLDVWQADAQGNYSDRISGRCALRGKVRTDEQGRYRFETVMPGAYGIGGGRSRPSHVHLRASRDGYRPLVTQLYFEGDPHLAGDPFARPPRTVPLRSDGAGHAAQFDLVLERR